MPRDRGNRRAPRDGNPRDGNPSAPRQEQSMLDVILLAAGLAFFAVSVGYAYACDRL